jgi:hypothetical protein
MDRPSARRPLPALAFLLALSLLTALVWWRVIHRADGGHTTTARQTCPAPSNSVVPQPRAVTIQVLNSTDRNNLAHNAATALGKVGFKVAGIGNDPNLVTGVAEIRYGTKGSAAAMLVSFYLPGATLVSKQSSDSGVEVSLGAKFKAVATTTQAKRTMASQHVSQLPAKAGPLAKTPTPQPLPTNC